MLNTIYMLKNRVNDKVYIGQTWRDLSERWDSSYGYIDSQRLWNAIEKYGKENFYYETLTFCGTQEAADACEIYFITKYDSTNKNVGYNIKGGGSHGKLAESTKKKISLSLTGKKQSEETKIKRGLYVKGRKSPKSLETRQKISIALTGRKMPEEQRLKVVGVPSPMKGKKHTDETKRRISSSKTGRKLSTETRRKMSSAKRGKPSNNQTNKRGPKGSTWKIIEGKRVYSRKET